MTTGAAEGPDVGSMIPSVTSVAPVARSFIFFAGEVWSGGRLIGFASLLTITCSVKDIWPR